MKKNTLANLLTVSSRETLEINGFLLYNGYGRLYSEPKMDGRCFHGCDHCPGDDSEEHGTIR